MLLYYYIHVILQLPAKFRNNRTIGGRVMTSSLLPGDGICLRRCRHLHGPTTMHGPTTVQRYCAACDSSRSCAKSSVASCQGRATTVNRSNDITCRPLFLVNFHGECFCVIITTENILTVHRSRCRRALFNML